MEHERPFSCALVVFLASSAPVERPSLRAAGETAIGASFDDGGVGQADTTKPFPWHVSGCGDFDLTLQPKPQGLYRQATAATTGTRHTSIRHPLSTPATRGNASSGPPRVSTSAPLPPGAVGRPSHRDGGTRARGGR